MEARIKMFQMNANWYQSPSGMSLKREEGLTPNNNPINFRWVLRDTQGKMLDFDQYRNDIAEKYNLQLESK